MADVRIEDLQLWLNSEITGNEKLPTSGKKAVTIAQIVNRMANVLDGKDIVIISARSGDYVATVQGWKAAVNAEFGSLHVRGQAAVGSLLSHDFVTGISGFKAGSDGNAEFKNLLARQSLTTGEITSTNYVSGALGSGFKIAADGSIEAESLSLRTGLTVPELVIKKITGQGGSIAVTDTMKITEVVGNVCKFDTAGGTIFNPFVVGDLLRCQRWNNGIKYYTAQVTAIDVDSFTVIIVHGGDAPAAGDEVFKFGNVSDTERQSLIYLTNSDTGAPYMDVLDGIDSADLSGKTKVRLGKLSGITDAHFGALEGHGLYANNAYLRDANVKGKIEMTDAAGNVFFSATQNLAGARIQNLQAHKIQVGGVSIMTDATGSGKIKADYLQVTKSLIVGATPKQTFTKVSDIGAYNVGDRLVQGTLSQWRDGKEFILGKTYVAKATNSIFDPADWDKEAAKIFRGNAYSLPEFYKTDDLFSPSNTFQYGTYNFVANTTYIATASSNAFVPAHWQPLSVEDAAAALAAATAAQTAAGNAQTAANNAQTTANNAQTTANAAQSAANALVPTFMGSATPSNPKIGSKWFDTNVGVMKWKEWNGSAWVVMPESDAMTAQWLRDAFLQRTDLLPGVILTSVIGVRNADSEVTAYINGNGNAHGTGIAFAAGVKNFATSTETQMGIDRHDGSGFRAGGKYWWDKSGNARIGAFYLFNDRLSTALTGERMELVPGKNSTFRGFNSGGNLGFELKAVNGLYSLTFYAPDGSISYKAGQSGADIPETPESFTPVPLYKYTGLPSSYSVLTGAQKTSVSTLLKTNSTRVNNVISISLSPATKYLYAAGNNVNTPTNAIYAGYKDSSTDKTDNVDDGWYSLGFAQQVGTTAYYDLVFIQGGKIVSGSTTQIQVSYASQLVYVTIDYIIQAAGAKDRVYAKAFISQAVNDSIEVYWTINSNSSNASASGAVVIQAGQTETTLSESLNGNYLETDPFEDVQININGVSQNITTAVSDGQERELTF